MDLSDAVVVNSSRLKSVVWNDFDRVKKGDTYVAICKHCNKRLSGSSTSGTSHLRNHLIRCKRILNHGIEQYSSPREKKNKGPLPLATIKVDTEQKIDEQLSTVNCNYQGRVKEVAVNFASGNLDHKKSQFDLARMTIMHGYPLDMVDHVGFKHFIKNLQPFYELLSPTSVEADCIEIYANEKQKMYEMLDKLPGRISLSIDLTALCDAEYLSLTAHYIDEFWQLKQRLLNFVLVDPSQTEDIKSEVIMTCLMDWDIDRKLFSMTYDGYSLHDNIVDRIRHRLSQNRFLFCDGVLFDVRCLINLIKMMVQEIFEGLFDVTRKIQESIQYVKSSEIGQVKFDELSLQAGVESKKCLCLDNPSRWDSSYIMLTAALEYRGVFSLLQDHDPSFLSCPSDIEWERASVVANHLKLFIDITNAITRSKYPTANIYFSEICDIQLRLNEWSKNLDEFSSSLMAKLKSMFEEYWDKCSLSLAVAAMLDPRYKMKLIQYYYQCLYGSASAELIEEVLNNIKVVYNEHSIGSPLASLDQGMACQVSGGASCLPNLADRLMGFDKFVHETSESPGSKSDLDKYLEEPLFPRTGDFDILNWWKVHTPRYPILSMMARNILAIPMANITHELAFSGEERVVDCSWSSVKADTLQALMCTRDWLTEVSFDAI